MPVNTGCSRGCEPEGRWGLSEPRTTIHGVDVPSPSQAKRAGSTIRKYMRGDNADFESYEQARDVMERWRRAHYIPLVTANNGLRSRAKTVGVEAEVTQRLKRQQTILEKLGREPTLDLSRMQDIGGCRAVVNTRDDLRRLEDRITSKAARVLNHYDYIAKPRSSGYRAVHIVTEYGGRQIEIQLRTSVMHSWALAAENYSSILGTNIKQDGSHPVQLFLALASEIMSLSEQGLAIPDDLRDEHQARRLVALDSLP